MSIEGQGHFFTIYFQVLYVLCFTRPRYQVSVYRTIGPLVFLADIFVPTLELITILPINTSHIHVSHFVLTSLL